MPDPTPPVADPVPPPAAVPEREADELIEECRRYLDASVECGVVRGVAGVRLRGRIERLAALLARGRDRLARLEAALAGLLQVIDKLDGPLQPVEVGLPLSYSRDQINAARAALAER